jgi:hypothetical protein
VHCGTHGEAWVVDLHQQRPHAVVIVRTILEIPPALVDLVVGDQVKQTGGEQMGVAQRVADNGPGDLLGPGPLVSGHSVTYRLAGESGPLVLCRRGPRCLLLLLLLLLLLSFIYRRHHHAPLHGFRVFIVFQVEFATLLTHEHSVQASVQVGELSIPTGDEVPPKLLFLGFPRPRPLPRLIALLLALLALLAAYFIALLLLLLAVSVVIDFLFVIPLLLVLVLVPLLLVLAHLVLTRFPKMMPWLTSRGVFPGSRDHDLEVY